MTAAEGCRDRPQGTVLIVEDEVLVRLDLADQLRSTGLTVLEASNADEALVVLEAIDGIALVVSDIRMPGAADGLDLVGWLRRERPAIKIVLVSEYIGTRRIFPIADLALAKPIDRALFVREVRRLLGADHTAAA